MDLESRFLNSPPNFSIFSSDYCQPQLQFREKASTFPCPNPSHCSLYSHCFNFQKHLFCLCLVSVLTQMIWLDDFIQKCSHHSLSNFFSLIWVQKPRRKGVGWGRTIFFTNPDPETFIRVSFNVHIACCAERGFW